MTSDLVHKAHKVAANAKRLRHELQVSQEAARASADRMRRNMMDLSTVLREHRRDGAISSGTASAPRQTGPSPSKTS